MKLNNIAKYLLGLLWVPVFMGSCTADLNSLDNSVYIAEAETEKATAVMLDDAAVSVPITVRAAHPVDAEVQVSLSVDPSVLDAYNQRYTQSYELLPAGYYSFDKQETVIAASQVSADPIVMELKPLSTEMLTSGKKYAVPVTIVSNGVDVLSASKSFVYLISSPILTDVVVVPGDKAHLTFPVDNPPMTNVWSFEFLLKTNPGSYWPSNQMMLGMWTKTSTGAAYEIFSRFGDVMIDADQYQVKVQGNPCNSKTHFKADEWYHIAGVCDGAKFRLYVNGAEDNSIPYDGATIALDDFYFGWTGIFHTFRLSELRLWQRALSPAELTNNKYAVDPNAEGLVGYWKLNDKAEKFQDATGKNADGFPTAEGVISWESQKWK